ncbi:BQ2448_1705 [Microbotryum intermedium]|uniref:BQ2448_1705 protein n=1 Tax=Microbotryum intermedium TaxID=269621 RepID=A0A238FDY3_9BASI|nr:BQ2448_1705 [Microbotryum intermedium]
MQDEVELQAPRPFPHQGSFWTTYWSTPEKTNLLASEVTPRADEERCVYCRDNDIDVCWQIRGGVVCLECKFAKRRCADCYGRRPHANDADQWFTSELDYLRVVENPHKLVKDILDKLPPAERERAKDEFDQFPRYARKQGDADPARAGSTTPAVQKTPPVKRTATPTLPATKPQLTPSTSTSSEPAVAAAKANSRDVGSQVTTPNTNGNGFKGTTTPEGSPPPYNPRKMGLVVNADRPPAAKKRRVAPAPIQVRSTTPEGTPPPWPPAGWIPRIKRSTTPPGSPPAHWPWPSVIATRRINYNIPASSKARVIRAQRFCEKMRDVLDKVDKDPSTDTDGLLTAIGRLGIGFGFGYHETFKRGGVLDEWWNGEQPDSPHRLIYARLNPENSRDIGIAAPRKFNLTRAVSGAKALRKRTSSAAKAEAASAGSPAPVGTPAGAPASTTPPGSPTSTAIPVYTPFIPTSAITSSTSTPDGGNVAAAKPAVNGKAASVTVPSKRKASVSGGKTQSPHASNSSASGKPMAPAAAKIAQVIKNIPAASTSKFAAPHQILAAGKPASKKATPTARPSGVQPVAGEHTPARTVASNAKLAASNCVSTATSTPTPAAPAPVLTSAPASAPALAPTPVSTSAPKPAPPPDSSLSFAAAPPKGSLKLGTSTNSAIAAASSVTRGTPTSAHKSARRI